nr:NFACT RNA binding domain-containing protein [endosymbiont 'TC1' of Trimyema compressum]
MYYGHKKETTSTGYVLLIGKNNKQNDYITFKLAKSNDLWFHAKDYPGSHVLLRNPNNDTIDDKTIAEVATYAATFSKGNEGLKADVDYTKKIH